MKRFLLTTIVVLCLFSSCVASPENTGSDSPEPNQTLTIASSDISLLASYSFETTEESRSITDEEYLVYAHDDIYEPILFKASDGSEIILGASKDFLEGSVKLLPVGEDAFLCVFDRLIIVNSKPHVEIHRTEEGFSSMVISIDREWTDESPNIAYMNLETGNIYLLNKPSFSAGHNEDYLDFLLFSGDDDSYGYSENRVFILADDGGLYTFRKDHPLTLVSVNNADHDPLDTNATVYTDDYVIYQYSFENPDHDGNSYIKVYDTSTKKVAKKTEIAENSPLDESLFNVGDVVFARERVNTEEYGFRIHRLIINDDMSISTGESKYFTLATGLTGSSSNKNKNSSFYITHDRNSTQLVRAENVFTEPILISAFADSNGNLSDIKVLKLTDGSEYPYPISNAVFKNQTLYWVGKTDPATIYKADLNRERIEKLSINGAALASDEISVTNNDEIIYHKFINGNTVGTYIWNPTTNIERIIAYNRMDIHQIYQI